MTPNQTQILGIVRMLMMALGSFLVTKGFLSSDQVAGLTTSLIQIIGPILMVAPTIWSLFVHTKAATVARAADIVPISASVQASAGVKDPVLVPSNPKQT